MSESKRLAGDLEAIAKEVVAAAHLYRNMLSGQNNLALGLEAIMDNLNQVYGKFREAHNAEKK